MFVINGRFLTQRPTGVHFYAMNICNSLYDLGADFVVVTPTEINPDYDIRFKTVSCGKLNTHLWEQLSLPRYLKSIGSPLLISLTGCGPLNYSNQIMTIHDVSHERHPEWFSKNYYRFYHYMMPRIARKAHQVLTVSEFSRNEIVDTLGVDPQKISVIYGDTPRHDIPPVTKNRTESERYIIAVSSMDPRKNFVRLVEAFKEIDDKSLKLYIIGMRFKAFNTPDMQNLITENVVLPGYVDDDRLIEMYQNAEFSVYPSLYEGFGIPPLEAMCCGCPVIASDIPAIKEISGDAVLYFDPYDVSDLTAKMNLLLNDSSLQDSLKEKGRAQVEKYSWKKSAQKLLTLIERYSS
ncbi:glycosyltransferase involved in cell wall biosynthesis [Dysgonomonas sp. PH5-45]|uniref:glycosyltransferase family 4 protein n=1 Tax=unclassified Dysgonomonas TaxID=2630389 RepID=UPI002476CE82|nr:MULTISPECIES: glycosyltransferase family 1 protein [unclassified Dysgonomonas]MDH6353918.1 glycosyltransferase involved in cell wall biosynthesis [Dysgonomonas sp. PH5-45]MDH6386820.1 glycosyltransferase involved in cell wall biosynthesis [Dysgonomonas sp. PH5-37]